MRSRVRSLRPLLAAIVVTAPLLHADVLRTDVPRALPLPPTARTVAIEDDAGTAIFAAPAQDATLAGATQPGVTFPVLEARRGTGCGRLWVRIGPDAWVCGDHVRLSVEEPRTEGFRFRNDASGLPWSYAFTSNARTPAYLSFGDALLASPHARADVWEQGWGFGVVEELRSGERRVFRTRDGHFFRREDVHRRDESHFHGDAFERLSASAPGLPFGWVVDDGVRAVRDPSDPNRDAVPFARFTPFALHGTRTVRGTPWVALGDGRWIREDHVRWVRPAPPPDDVDPAGHEHWIDVDLRAQTLVAWEGARPVFATLVSSGAGRFATPEGEFRIHARHLVTTMDNTEITAATSHFRFADVPWVQFFDRDRGFHAAYWHQGFGTPRSHGCVNLSPADARWLFAFTTEPLPAGWLWRAIPEGRGTRVRVRGRWGG